MGTDRTAADGGVSRSPVSGAGIRIDIERRERTEGGDPFGRALRDHHRGKRTGPLYQRDGAETRDHPVEELYFGEFCPETPRGEWLDDCLNGPLLDVGAGAGRHARYFQTQFETIAVERSPRLVATMAERGVAAPRQADMFALSEAFDAGRFVSALAYGTQAGLSGSVAGLESLLEDFATVTTADGTLVLDFYDPETDATAALLGYRADPTPGLAYRAFHFEYEGSVGETLLFRLFSPDRVREAAAGTPWTVADVYDPADSHPAHYFAALTK